MSNRIALPPEGQTTLSYDPQGCTLLMMIHTFNSRQRARLAELGYSSAENARLKATISFKKRDYLPTIHQELRDHLMRLMIYTITTKGYDIVSDNNNQDKSTTTKFKAKIDVRELNHILKSTLCGVKTFDNSEVDERFAEVTLDIWDA